MSEEKEEKQEEEQPQPKEEKSSRKKLTSGMKQQLTACGVSEVHLHKLEEISDKVGGLNWLILLQLVRLGQQVIPLIIALFESQPSPTPTEDETTERR